MVGSLKSICNLIPRYMSHNATIQSMAGRLPMLN